MNVWRRTETGGTRLATTGTVTSVAERHDAEFQQLTGAPGNILFVKRIQK
jgi:hypothetical protein